jgi:hypothetical protein
MAVGSIIIKQNPVSGYEKFSLTAVPSNHAGSTEAAFEDYRPQDRAEGGFWNMTFKLFARENILKDMFENGLGRHVEVWGDGLQQDFEGMIYELVYNLPPDRFVISLENMANTMFMRTDYDDDGTVERTTVLTNQDSIDRFGTKEIVVSGGETEGLTVADQAVQTFMDLRAFPKPEALLQGGKGDPYLEVHCKGYIKTLDWQTYNQTGSSGTQGASAEVSDIIDDAAPYVASKEIDGGRPWTSLVILRLWGIATISGGLLI